MSRWLYVNTNARRDFGALAKAPFVIESAPVIAELLVTRQRLLAECAVAERLRRLPGIELHPTLFNTPLVNGPEPARAAMRRIYGEYAAIARQAGLPLLLTAPTWRLDALRLKEAGFSASLIDDAVNFLADLIANLPADQGHVVLGALLGPKADCYRPDLAPGMHEAYNFHQPQIDQLASSRADLLLAQTLPSLPEALGIARAMAETSKPYLISFCTGSDGKILDGTSLPDAMSQMDKELETPPLGYFVNCTHPDFLLNAYQPGELDRLVGIQANGSSRDVTELDGSSHTEADPVDRWSRSMLKLHQTHQVKVLGGCCGTSHEHLQALTANSGVSTHS